MASLLGCRVEVRRRQLRGAHLSFADSKSSTFGQEDVRLPYALLAPEALTSETPHDLQQRYRVALLEGHLLPDSIGAT